MMQIIIQYRQLDLFNSKHTARVLYFERPGTDRKVLQILADVSQDFKTIAFARVTQPSLRSDFVLPEHLDLLYLSPDSGALYEGRLN